MMNLDPDPNSGSYRAAADAILKEMRKVAIENRDACDEIEETWPYETRIFPVGDSKAEGVLYMPKAAKPVRLFQSCCHEKEDQYEVHVDQFIPHSYGILEMALDYQKRADQYINVCQCGHVIPRVHPIGIHIDHDMTPEEFEALMDEQEEGEIEQEPKPEPRPIRTAEDMRIASLNFKEEEEYICPACGMKPNKRYG